MYSGAPSGQSDIAAIPNARLVSWANVRYFLRSAATIVTYLLLLKVFHVPYWAPISVFVLAINFAGRRRLQAISWANIFFWLFTGSLMTTAPASMDKPDLQWPYFPDGWAELVEPGLAETLGLALVIVALFGGLYFTLFSIHRRWPRLRQPVAWCMLIFLGASWLCHLRLGAVGNAIFIGLFFALSKSFWVMAYQLSEVDFMKKRPFWAHFGTLNSPWQTTWVVSGGMRGYGDFANHEPKSIDDVSRAQRSGIVLLLRALVLTGFDRMLRASLFRRDDGYFGWTMHGLPYYVQNWNIAGILDHQLGRGYAWIYVLGRAMHFLLEYTILTHALLSIVRICGFQPRRNVYKPYEATSFNNFLGRIYFYYISLLQRFFFFPLWAQTRALESRALRVFLTHFGTIFCGGLIYTFERNAPSELLDSFPGIYEAVSYRLPYFVCLGLFCSVTALLPDWPEWSDGRFGRAGRSFLYFAMYALCFTWQTRLDGGLPATLGQRFEIFTYLFGF